MRFYAQIIATFALVLLAPATASAAAVTCLNLAKTSTVLVNNNTTTSATAAVNIIGASQNNVAGSDSCVVVEYTAQFKAPQGARLSLLVTGNNPAPVVFPSTQDVVTAGTGFDTKTVTFVLPKVNCSCLIQVRIQSVKSGQSISGGRGVLRVLYNNNEP